jgi:predicted TIM-barrel fold metal-dependent hydrolase
VTDKRLQDTWLAQLREPIIDADRPICDPHHHLWDHERNPYLLPELLADMGEGHNIVSTVFMECGAMYRADGPTAEAPLGETEFVNSVAAMSASGQYGPARVCAGIVGFADLSLGADVGAILDAHMTLSPRFRGIRHASGWDASEAVRNSHTNPSRHLLRDDNFRQGIAELEKRSLSFDAWLYHPQIPELIELAQDFPSLTIIADHFCGPLGIGPYAGQEQAIYADWQADFKALGACQNVYAKLGGIAMPVNGFGWHHRNMPASSDELVEATGRYHLWAIEHFGAERCMFESNFPVDRQSCSYHVLWNAFKKLASVFTADEQNALFHDTAVKVYGI